MKIARITNGLQPPEFAFVLDERLVLESQLAEIEGLRRDSRLCQADLFDSWTELQRIARKALDKSTFRVDEFRVNDLNFEECLEAPLPAPGKVICVGQNYADHVKEMGSEIGELPVIFNKFPSVVCGPGSAIQLPSISSQVDYEGELVVVIGQAGRSIPIESAGRHIFGYCCGNDISARDWQKGRPGGQWLLGKSCDTFAPLGPWLVTRDAIANAESLRLRTRLNGQVVQDSNTSNLIFKIDFLIAHLSKFFELQPGDLIFTGTPPGVGAARTPPLFLQGGDQIEVEIEAIGTLRNSVVAATG